MAQVALREGKYTGNYNLILLSLVPKFKHFDETRMQKAASGRLTFERGYNQTCHWY